MNTCVCKDPLVGMDGDKLPSNIDLILIKQWTDYHGHHGCLVLGGKFYITYSYVLY